MREDGERLVAEGITSPEEVHARHARDDARARAWTLDMPAYRFEALDAAGKPRTGLLEADNAEGRARAAARARRWCRSASRRSVAAGTGRPARAALHAPRLQRHRPGGLDAPARRPGRLRPAARARADRAGRRGRGPAPARAGGAPAQRGQRRLAVRPRAGAARRASSTTSTARVVAAGEQSGALGARARAPGRRPRRAPGAAAPS